MKIDSYAKEKLKASIPIEAVADHLGLRGRLDLKQKGNSLKGNCLDGHKSTSGECFSLNKEANCFHCFSCGKTFDAIALVEKERNVTYPEACKYLAEIFMPHLLDEILNSNLVAPETKKSHLNSNLYEMIFEYGHELLFKKEGITGLEYLTKIRGCDSSKLRDTQWMYWPKDEEIREFLKKNIDNDRHSEVDELKLNGIGGDAFRVALPYRDRFGRILGFAKRAAVKEGIKVEGQNKPIRWSFTAGLEKSDLFGLHRCKRNKQSKQLLLLEGLPDAAYLPSLGIENIVALGQADLSKKNIDGLKIYEIESVIIAFDNDKPNEKGEIGSVEKAKKAADLLEENGIKSFILPQHLLGEHKDPDEFVRANGIEAFQNLVQEKAQSRARWLPYYYSYKSDLRNEFEVWKVLSGIAKEFVSMENAFEKKVLIEEMETFFGLSKEEIESVFKDAIEKQRKKDEEEKRKKDIEEIQMALHKGDIAKAKSALAKIESESHKDSLIIPPYTVTDLKTDLNRIKEGLKTGYKEFDDILEISQEAITILAGRPGHGKTTTLLNFFVNMVELYPDRSFCFFSYEETRSQILLKILNMLAGCTLSKTNNLSNLSGYLRGNHTSQAAINKAVKLLQELTESQRLIIADKSYYVDDLSKIISNLSKERGNIGAIFIDYIQKIKLRAKYAMRQNTLQEVSGEILEMAKINSLPIILGAQFGRAKGNKNETLRMDNIREAGDIEQDANLIISIWNQAKEDAEGEEGEGKKSQSEKTDLELKVIKNRNGPDGQKIILEFNRPLNKLNNKEPIFKDNWNL